MASGGSASSVLPSFLLFTGEDFPRGTHAPSHLRVTPCPKSGSASWRTEPKMWLLDTLSRWSCPLWQRKWKPPCLSLYLPIYLPQTHPVPTSTVQQTKCAFLRPSFLNLHTGLHSHVLRLLVVIVLVRNAQTFSCPHSLGTFLPWVCPSLLSGWVSQLHPVSAILFLDSLAVSIMYFNVFFPFSPILLYFHHLLPWLFIFFISIFNPRLTAEK